ncbi:MAG: hypothetical protein ACN6OY_11020, partial [Pseudomonas alloputida]
KATLPVGVSCEGSYVTVPGGTINEGNQATSNGGLFNMFSGNTSATVLIQKSLSAMPFNGDANGSGSGIENKGENR